MDSGFEMSPVAQTTCLGVVQMESIAGEIDRNFAVAEAHVRELAARGAELVVLPELFLSGYDLAGDLESMSEPAGGPLTARLVGLAAELDLILGTAILTKLDDGALVDLAVIVSGDGVLASAPKRFLWGDESKHFERGSEPLALAKTSVGTVGVAICYEAGFPETVRELAFRGAEIVAVPAAFGRQRLYAWDLLTRSRALENGCFVAAAGLTGASPAGAEFAAHSRIVSPRGEVIAGLQDAPGVAIANADLAEVGRSRAAIPYLSDLVKSPISTTGDPGEPEEGVDS